MLAGAICIATWTTIFQPWFNRLTIYTAVHELLQYCGYSISISPCRLCTHCSWLMKCRAARVFNLPLPLTSGTGRLSLESICLPWSNDSTMHDSNANIDFVVQLLVQ